MPVTRSFFQRIPFIRISSLFILGVLINQWLHLNLQWVGILLTILVSALIFLWYNSSYSAVKIHNYIVAICILTTGIFYPHNTATKQLITFDIKDYYVAEVCQQPIEKTKSFQSILKIHGRAIKNPEKVIAYFSKENFDSTISVGDQLIILTKPQQINNMGNPFEFDYRSMMHNKGIYYSVFLKQPDYKLTGKKIFRISYQAEKVRDKLLALLEDAPIEKRERAVMSALTLGYRAELDPETIDYFADTGTIHVLSVSGLHVALIFFILNFVLSGIRRIRFGTIIYPVIVILFLWLYAFITGFTPSVQRATVMFTFVVIGNSIRRPVNIYNSLTASALMLVMLDPMVLFDIGFQMSYLAVFGIVLLQPPLTNIIPTENKIIKWLWTMFAVSLAAQLLTFPLGILYFNQFPNLFWLSNYFLIPGTTLITWVVFAFFIVSPVPLVSEILAKTLQIITYYLLELLKYMSEIPYAVSEGIVFTPIQTLFIYGFFVAFIVYLFSKNKSWLFVGLILVIFFQGTELLKNYHLLNQRMVYSFNSKGRIIHLINGRSNYVLSASGQPITDQEIKMIENVKTHLKLEKPKLLDITLMGNFKTADLTINKQSICFLNCKIIISDQLLFQIHNDNTFQFPQRNDRIRHQAGINTTIESSNTYSSGNLKNIYSFKNESKKALSIILN